MRENLAEVIFTIDVDDAYFNDSRFAENFLEFNFTFIRFKILR